VTAPLTITFTLPDWSLRPAGGSRVVYGYAERLAERGHHVRIVHAAFMPLRQYRHVYVQREVKNLMRGALDRLGRRPHRVPWLDVCDDVDLRWVTLLGPEAIPPCDVVVATSWRTASPVAALPRDRGGRAYLIQHHETWDAPAAVVDATWRLPMERVVIAGWLVDVARRLGVADGTEVVPNAIDLDRFRATTPLDQRERRVAMLWSSAPIKGGAVGLQALEVARRSVPDLRATLFGVGAPPRGLPPWAEYVRGPSGQDLVDGVYGRARVYLCPSRGEGWHLPPAEAMACGCAVVTTAIDGVADYAHAERTALLAPVDDADGLAAQLVRALSDLDLCRALADAGHAEVGRFSWDRSTDALEAVLHRSTGVAR